MITVLQRVGSSQMVSVLHRGGPENDLGLLHQRCHIISFLVDNKN